MHWTGKVQPVAFSLFGRDVAWYGIIITAAMLIGLFGAIQLCKKIKLKSDDVLEMFLIAIPCAILCARLGFVFSKFSTYFLVDNFGWDDFVNIFAVWDGGLTVLTGVPGGVLGAFIWSKWRKVDILRVVDVAICIVLLSQAIGRWGNFFNQEIYGQPVLNEKMQFFPYAVYIANMKGFYQATFFYESVLNLIGFFVLYLLSKRLYLRGSGGLLYIIYYGTVRFIMEFMRDNSSISTSIDMIPIICGIVVLAAGAVLAVYIIKTKKKGIRVWYGKGIPEKVWKPAKYAIYKEGKTDI